MKRTQGGRVVGLAAVCCYVCLLAAAMAVAEQPLTKDEIAVLLLGGSSSEKIITVVGQRGVDFRMDPDIAKEFHDAGASDELIEALQRAGGSVMSAPPSANATAPETTRAAPGAPPASTTSGGATPTETAPVSTPTETVLVPASTALELELQDSLNTQYTRSGDSAAAHGDCADELDHPASRRPSAATC